MNRRYVFSALALVVLFAAMCPAGIIVSVDRSRGQPNSGTATKAPIGTFDQNTDPLLGTFANGEGVFSDRTYVWADVPAWSGAELVRTFNDDKKDTEIMVTYTVTISEAAVLAMVVDDRIGSPLPENLTEFVSQQEAVDWTTMRIGPPGTFADTGMNVTIMELTNPRTMSIYATATAMDPGTYVFGSQPTGKNFYSIIAVPEPASLLLLGLGGLLLRKRR